MTHVGIWRVSDGKPVRLAVSTVPLERDLEDWIEQDPSLLEAGLTVVARQLRTIAGPLDLLAIDPQGRWVLIEIKRGRLHREVVAQAVDYAAALSRIDRSFLRERCEEYMRQRSGQSFSDLISERGVDFDIDGQGVEVIIYLVGDGVDPRLEEMVEFLGANGSMEIRVVTFSVFEDPAGGLMLSREIHESSATLAQVDSRSVGNKSTPSVDELLHRADVSGVGPIVRPIVEAATEVGLYPRTYATSIMLAPPKNRSRCLIYLPVSTANRVRENQIKAYIAAETFEQFFGTPISQIQDAMGFNEYAWIDEQGAAKIAGGLRSLFAG